MNCTLLRSSLVWWFPAVLFLTGCSSAYYGTLEKFGIPKRQVLADRVAKARESQEDAKQQFASALDKFLAITKVEPGELKTRYDLLSAELKRNESRATEVRDRLAGVKDVADALFKEWKEELKKYTNSDLRRNSEQQLETTQESYRQLITVMDRAASRMDPVLNAFRDQVLYLKHNLNAQAVRSLATTSEQLQDDIRRLIGEMEKSIKEADAFIKTLKPAN